jgi:hypothetical protein
VGLETGDFKNIGINASSTEAIRKDVYGDVDELISLVLENTFVNRLAV